MFSPGESEGDLMGEGPTDDDIGVKADKNEEYDEGSLGLETEDPFAEAPLLPPGVKS